MTKYGAVEHDQASTEDFEVGRANHPLSCEYEVKLGFEEPQTIYSSGSQRAKSWTERWVADWMFCPSCGADKLSPFPPNTPLADFFCPNCSDQFELKAKHAKRFGKAVADGAYATKIERLRSKTNPNLMLLNYDKEAREVRDVCVVPKHFFVPDIVQRRPPLGPTARRAGWVGSNILIHLIPSAGRIFIVRDGVQEPREHVLLKWRQTAFLADTSIEARGWLLEVMKAVEGIGQTEFRLEDVYAFEANFGLIYPNNHNIRPKIRQQLQVLRDSGYLDFLGRGQYRVRR